MNVIEIEGFNFLEVSQSPNIIISLKGERNFSEESIKSKNELLEKYFGVSSYQEFNQTHSTNILGIDTIENNEFDGFLSTDRKAAFAIKTADCIPLLLWDEEQSVISGLHCGWKGLKNDIIAKAIEGNSSKPFTHAYIGPHISREHFEVQDDFIEAFIENNKDIAGFLSNIEGRTCMNLRQYTVHELHQYGIEVMNNFSPCSYLEKDHFFSWRRDNANPFRNLTIAWF
jgi:YfiH family protein